MTISLEPLGIHARQWAFLGKPERYVEASRSEGRPLELETTRRQCATAIDILSRINGSGGRDCQRGVLLADDVGLGKTTVAALVAWVVAAAGRGQQVRILAPNDVMVRRWQEELVAHVPMLQRCARHLPVKESQVKAQQVKRLNPGCIQVASHHDAVRGTNLRCGLLIVDEAHRAKGDDSQFARALRREARHACRVLVLTATPFSIHIDELERMLDLVGGAAGRVHVRQFTRVLHQLKGRTSSAPPEMAAGQLSAAASAAVAAIKPFLVRHCVDDLHAERQAFGDVQEWRMPIPRASAEEMETLLRVDRALRMAAANEKSTSRSTNDARFHVGWRHLDVKCATLQSESEALPAQQHALVAHHLSKVSALRETLGAHSKMKAVVAAVKPVIAASEKVVLFCRHHATAQELAALLSVSMPTLSRTGCPGGAEWAAAWSEALASDEEHEELREAFIDWLCSDLVRVQCWSWMRDQGRAKESLADALRNTTARHPTAPTISAAAVALYKSLVGSRSSQAVLRAVAYGQTSLPGSRFAERVQAVCPPSLRDDEEHLFVHNQQPDAMIAVFNSPFGPDALVATDRLSEGIDLHRYCRHLVHYELDPSPVRTVQRNGRLRRVNSWAATTGQPAMYAYPAFAGTRDERLVLIMKRRLDSFSLLLGGGQGFDLEDTSDADEAWRLKVIAGAQASLKSVGSQLRSPGC